MKASDVDRLVVAFADLLNVERVLVVGSQAIHAYHPDPPIDVVIASIEVDVVPLPYDRYERWFFYAHEKLGDQSDFALENNDMYVDMLKLSAVKLPREWERRCIRREISRTGGQAVSVLYPGIYDLAIAKLLANRPQDVDFLKGLIELGYVDRSALESTLELVALPASQDSRKEWTKAAIRDAFRPSG